MQFELLERKAKEEPRFKMPAANFSVRMENQTKKLLLDSLKRFIFLPSISLKKQIQGLFFFFFIWETEGHFEDLDVELSLSEG